MCTIYRSHHGSLSTHIQHTAPVGPRAHRRRLTHSLPLFISLIVFHNFNDTCLACEPNEWNALNIFIYLWLSVYVLSVSARISNQQHVYAYIPYTYIYKCTPIPVCSCTRRKLEGVVCVCRCWMPLQQMCNNGGTELLQEGTLQCIVMCARSLLTTYELWRKENRKKKNLRK